MNICPRCGQPGMAKVTHACIINTSAAQPPTTNMGALHTMLRSEYDALVAERDEARESAQARWEVSRAAQAEVARLREALERIIEGDAAHQSYAMLMQIVRAALAVPDTEE